MMVRHLLLDRRSCFVYFLFRYKLDVAYCRVAINVEIKTEKDSS